MWTAIYLRQKFPSAKITIIEKGTTPAGASTRNAGFACFGSPTEIYSDIESMGADKALQLVEMRFEGLRTIQQVFGNAAVDMNICKGYELLDNEYSAEKILALNEQLYPITGATDTFYFSNDKIDDFGFNHIRQLLENRFEGSLHPGKLIRSLAQLAVRNGIQILYATEIKSIQESTTGVRLFTNAGLHLFAERIVYCTNAFSNNLVPQADVVPTRGQILLTAPVPDLKFNGTFHYQEGFYYFRNLNNCILLGGARNSSFETEYTKQAFTTLPIQQILERFLTTVILPGKPLPTITHRWAGIMAMGKDKFPVVEQLSDRSFCALRMSGMGLALAPTVGKNIAAMM